MAWSFLRGINGWAKLWEKWQKRHREEDVVFIMVEVNAEHYKEVVLVPTLVNPPVGIALNLLLSIN